MPGRNVSEILRQSAFPGTAKPRTVVDRIPPQARVVLIGEASHGTHEFYHARAEITKLLIDERDFNAVVTEAGDVSGTCMPPKCMYENALLSCIALSVYTNLFIVTIRYLGIFMAG